jgi:hypothetical protein
MLTDRRPKAAQISDGGPHITITSVIPSSPSTIYFLSPATDSARRPRTVPVPPLRRLPPPSRRGSLLLGGGRAPRAAPRGWERAGRAPWGSFPALPWPPPPGSSSRGGGRGPRLAGPVAPRCPEVPSWWATHPFPGEVAPAHHHAQGGRVSRGADGRVHGSPAAPSRLGKWSSQGEARRPAKELWAAPMASSNRFSTMLCMF